ncbi:DUF4917 family protein [Tardiphaga sp.]|uniref:DUF4917 family protein n=1 Tax=Tardiphaga sp. TaxID=1926292 RepID=UPI0026230B9E|nr:DUF4917 family protein [Tardiphaga sp.]MDB5620404.1 hypothetical protein [Tardiphaga sp.]
MPEVIDFKTALNSIGAESCSILLGNGFSHDYCGYSTLLEKAGLDAGEPCRRLFDQLDTPNFERVVRALEDASTVEATYGHTQHAARLLADAGVVRRALISAIQAAHPTHLDKMKGAIPACLEFLNPFRKIFTTNYDLLLYWVIIKSNGKFGDGFFKARDADGFRGPFAEDRLCNVYNIHGGLHLFRRKDGEIEKRLAGNDGGLEAIGQTIADDHRYPIYVAEGSAESKQKRIWDVPLSQALFSTTAGDLGLLLRLRFVRERERRAHLQCALPF